MKKVLYVFILTFILNFIWEVSQSVLFSPHYNGIISLLKVHTIASLGDIVIIASIFAISYILFGFNYLKDGYHINILLAVITIGFTLSVFIEKYALSSGRWSYNSIMPIIPFLKVGLTPVLQMMVIPLVMILIWVKNK